MSTLDIVGGGIAGLTLAATLHRPDWGITIYERGTPEGRSTAVDTAFGLWPPAMAALDEIGLGDRVRSASLALTRATIRTADGRIIKEIIDQHVEMIGRRSLHELLLAARPPGIGWEEARVEDVTALTGDAVVGADGASSVVRRDVWGAGSRARPQGVTVVRGVADAHLGVDALHEYWGDGTLFGCTPMPGGRTNWFCVFDERRFASIEQGLEHTRSILREFPDQASEVTAHATAQQTVISGIDVSRGSASFVRGRSVLIGDAAHAMHPNLGRGACEAIRDAVSLGSLLNTREPADALARYRRTRLIGPQAIRLLSSAAARVALARGRTARWRNRVLAREPA